LKSLLADFIRGLVFREPRAPPFMLFSPSGLFSFHNH
jgi:hypothetical protein